MWWGCGSQSCACMWIACPIVNLRVDCVPLCRVSLSVRDSVLAVAAMVEVVEVVEVVNH